MENYPANSNRAMNGDSDDSKPIKKIVTGEVSRRKKSLGKRFLETFVGGDSTTVWQYVVEEVLIPAAKDLISDAVTQGIDRMLFGDSRPIHRRSGSRPSSGYVSYNRYSSSTNSPWPSRGDRRNNQNLSRRARATHSFDEFVLESRQEGDRVLDNMFEVISKHNVVTVSDLYDLLGISSNFTDNDWGWTDIRGSRVTKVREGYVLDLPKPELLD